MNQIIDNGLNNILVINGDQKIKLEINGNNNKIIFSEYAFPAEYLSIKIFGDGNSIDIGRLRRVSRLDIVVKNGGKLVIKEKTTFESTDILCEKTEIYIGKDCMISYGTTFRNVDIHGLYSIKNGECLNESKSIFIGDHVRVDSKTDVSLGTIINNNSVIGSNSYLRDINIESNVFACGNPITIIHKDVIWDRKFTKNLFSADAIFDQFLKDSFKF